MLLKRGFGATIDEWLMAAEYVLSAGNANVILCERGIRTFEHATRNTLDLSAVPVLREMTHLPVIVDPSHGTGKRSLVAPMALAAAAVGADGLIIEVHPDPPHARSDGDQSLSFPEFGALMDELRRQEFLRTWRRRQDAAGRFRPAWTGCASASTTSTTSCSAWSTNGPDWHSPSRSKRHERARPRRGARARPARAKARASADGTLDGEELRVCAGGGSEGITADAATARRRAGRWVATPHDGH